VVRAFLAVVTLCGLAACTATAVRDGVGATASGQRRVAVSPSPAHDVAHGSDVTTEPADAALATSITNTIGGRDVSVAIGIGHRIVYGHLGDVPRVLASNEKLLTSMAALDLLGPSFRFATRAEATSRVSHGVLRGNLWLVGGGDPTLTTTDLAGLATQIRADGVHRIAGDVVGDTGTFDRGWWAPGWLRGISRQYVTRPTALRLAGGDASPEAEAAAAFRAALASAGVMVDGPARVGRAPHGARTFATDRSPALRSLLVHQNHESDNLYAELTTKFLGGEDGAPASTAGGAAAIQRWAGDVGVAAEVRDGSGLSDQDRTSATGMVTLLLAAERERWFPALEASLPRGGEGTLSSRLIGVPVRAKTGTLFIRPASTLSGYVTTRAGSRVAFSVLTHDLPEGTALAIEDAVVRTLAAASIR
jgi:D-alanyl-D-alanine carboxypeptidase/D-alanyl-D-alanine-endopeptidase (penicillin-binding protein 4)